MDKKFFKKGNVDSDTKLGQNNKTEEMQIFQSILEILLFSQRKVISIPKLTARFKKISCFVYVFSTQKHLRKRYLYCLASPILENINLLSL